MRRLSLGSNIAFSPWQSQQSRILNENSPISSSIRLNSHLIGSQYISPHSSVFHESQLVLACVSWHCFSWLFHQLRLKVSAKGVEKSRDSEEMRRVGENITRCSVRHEGIIYIGTFAESRESLTGFRDFRSSLVHPYLFISHYISNFSWMQTGKFRGKIFFQNK